MSSEKVCSVWARSCAHLPGCSPAIDKWKTTLNILNRRTLFFSSSFGNGKVYKCSAINEASSALKVTASVDLNVCATLSPGSCWRATTSNCSLCSDWGLMVELNPPSGPVSTNDFLIQTMRKSWFCKHVVRVKLKRTGDWVEQHYWLTCYSYLITFFAANDAHQNISTLCFPCIC